MLDIAIDILKNEKIEFNKLSKSESGFSNLVFFVDDDYVLKLLEQNGNELKFDNEMGFYKNMSFDFIPKCISLGEYKNTKYILMKKLKGIPLYEVWHRLSHDERRNVTIQIARILRRINRCSNIDFLNKRYIRDDMIKLYKNAFSKNIEIIKNKGFNTDFLEKYAKERVPIVFKESTLGLVYNDAHFDNFIYDGKTVKLIDFDRILYTSIDYELLILNTMVHNPTKFANERMESYVEIEDYKEILPIIKNEYPELFNFKYLDERLYIYTFFYTLGNIYTFELYDMLPEVLDRFKEMLANNQ
jgi:aminoglycoside phosphotransferase (APT) family kinase protein